MVKKFLKVGTIVLGGVFVMYLIGWVFSGREPTTRVNSEINAPIRNVR